MLQNRIYRGEIVHKNQAYPGEHAPIIDDDLWQEVQKTLAANRVDRGAGKGNRHVSLLAGLIYDAHGEPMTPSHAVKKGVRYRYYVSKSLLTGDDKATEEGSAHSGCSYRGSGHWPDPRMARRSGRRAERSSVSWARRRYPEEASGRGGAACRLLAGARCRAAACDPPCHGHRSSGSFRPGRRDARSNGRCSVAECQGSTAICSRPAEMIANSI